MNPETFGRYRLGRRLGEGRLGRVRAATDAEGREYAIKVVTVAVAPDAVRDFLAVQSTLVGVTHENLVCLRDVVVKDGTVALAQDLVPGGSLRARLAASGTLLPTEIARIGAGVAGALQAVHDAGCVHGAIRPENVLMDDTGAVRMPRLTDAGTDRLAPPAGHVSLQDASRYDAPEVVQGADPGPPSDVYALGMLLYELYCGVTPFTGGYVRDPAEGPGEPAGIPEPLWDLLRLLLAVDPAQRPGAGAVSELLRAMLPDLVGAPVGRKLDRPPPTDDPRRPHPQATIGDQMPVDRLYSPPPAKRKKWLPVAIVAVVVVAGGITAVSLLGSSPTPTAAPGTTAPAASVTPTQAPPVTTSAAPTIAPNLVGQPVSAARDQLGGIQVDIVDSVGQTGRPDTVIAQDPQAGSPLNGRITLTVARTPVEQYLTELDPVDGGFEESHQTGAIGGKTYLHTLAHQVEECSEATSAEFNIAKGYRRLVTTAGLDDNSSDSSLKVQLEIFGDGRKLLSTTLELGKPATVDVDLTGVLRLKIGWEPIKSQSHDYCDTTTNYLDLGEAKLLGLPNEVPSPAATTTG